MNRFINTILLFLFFPTMAIAVYVGFDLPVEFFKTTGAQLRYIPEVFLLLAVFMLVLLVRRSLKRWMGMRIVLQQDRFKWNRPISSERRRRVYVYTILENCIILCAAAGLYALTPLVVPVSIVLMLSSIDAFIFLLLATRLNGFLVGISSKAIIASDREVNLVYFTGLRKVSVFQQSIFFDYIKGLQLNFPSNCVEENNQEEFFSVLKEQLDHDHVLVQLQPAST